MVVLCEGTKMFTGGELLKICNGGLRMWVGSVYLCGVTERLPLVSDSDEKTDHIPQTERLR
jgi:hypothetical protein